MKIFNFFEDIVKTILVALIIVVPIRYFLFQPFIVNGQSMEPNYAHGDYLIIDSISYRFREHKRGEVIVFHYPIDPSFRHIKRIVGLPGETIKIEGDNVKIISAEKIIILDESDYLPYTTASNGMEISLGENEFFVMGDNRDVSFDSRKWGVLLEDYIIGKVFIRAFPFDRAKIAEIPNY